VTLTEESVRGLTREYSASLCREIKQTTSLHIIDLIRQLTINSRLAEAQLTPTRKNNSRASSPCFYSNCKYTSVVKKLVPSFDFSNVVLLFTASLFKVQELKRRLLPVIERILVANTVKKSGLFLY
jgi:hypothetical protein